MTKLTCDLNDVCFLTDTPEKEKVVIDVKDIPIINPRKKKYDFTFKITDECKYIKELVLSEGLIDFDVDETIDGKDFALEKIIFPSTISMTAALPKLWKFSKLMLVYIKPSKKIQVKFAKPRYIVCNLKKKNKLDLFYKYNSDYTDDTIDGIAYISDFKEEKLLHYDHGYYYLVENENDKAYRLVKTDDVESFEFLKEVNGIPVKYIDLCCFKNVKNDPSKDCKTVSKFKSMFGDMVIELKGINAFIAINNLKPLGE